MSVSRWVIAAAFGLAAALILLGAGAIYTAQGLLRTWEKYDQYQESAYKDAYQSAAKAQAKCQIGSAPADWSEQCLVEQMQAHTEDRDRNQDLRAQQDMAYWAKVMFFTSAGGLVVSIFGLIALFISLAQTRKAIADTREIGEAQVRAYISIEPQKMRTKGDRAAEITAVVRNTGQTPALEVEIATYVAPFEGRIKGNIFGFEDFPKECVQRLMTIPSGGSEKITIPIKRFDNDVPTAVLLMACPRYKDVFMVDPHKGDANTGPNVAWVYEGESFVRPEINPKQN